MPRDQQDAGPEATDTAYTVAFRAAQLDVDSLDVTEAANRLKRRPAALVAELAAYLDHWSDVRRTSGRPAAAWRKPLEVAREADADNYRDRLRTLLAGDDRKAQAAPLQHWPASRWPASYRPRRQCCSASPSKAPAIGRRQSTCSTGPWRGIPAMSGSISPWPGPWGGSGRRCGGAGAVLHGRARPAARDRARLGPPARLRWVAAPRPRPSFATWLTTGATPRGISRVSASASKTMASPMRRIGFWTAPSQRAARR